LTAVQSSLANHPVTVQTAPRPVLISDWESIRSS